VSWNYKFGERAFKQLKKLDRLAQQRIIEFLDSHVFDTNDPRQHGKPLMGDLRGLWRYRVGDYRIVCQLQDAAMIVLVIRVGHRKNIYE
jgi:mRNA interferase RelE/StbE